MFFLRSFIHGSNSNTKFGETLEIIFANEKVYQYSLTDQTKWTNIDHKVLKYTQLEKQLGAFGEVLSTSTRLP